MSDDYARWINDVRDQLGDEYAAVARAMLDGSWRQIEDVDSRMLKMGSVGLLDEKFVKSDQGGTWTLRFSVPDSYKLSR